MLSSLTEEQKRKLIDPIVRDINLNEWAPSRGPQRAVISSEADEVLYGGAAGGGKTSVLVNIAKKFKSALLIRRTFPQLEDSIVFESKKWFGDRKQYNSSKHTWALAGGIRVRMGHMERDDDMYQYQGAEFDFIGIDELTQLNRIPYEYLLSRLRSSSGRKCRVVSTSNPGGAGHGWVKARWAAWLDVTHSNPASPGELRWYARNAVGSEIEVQKTHKDAVSRTFIPAKLSDNPYLGDAYRRTLSLLPEPYRTQLLEGNWDAGEEDDAYQVIPTAWVQAAQARWEHAKPGPLDVVGVDVAHGGDDCTVLAHRHGSVITRIDKYPGRSTPDGQAVVALIGQALMHGGKAVIDAMPPSAYDIARGLGMRVDGINFGSGSDQRDKSGQFGFANLRAEMWWRLRELLAPESETPIALPPDGEIIADLTAPKWSVQVSGIRIEPKDDIKKRLGRSPDVGDALALAFHGMNYMKEGFIW